MLLARHLHLISHWKSCQSYYLLASRWRRLFYMVIKILFDEITTSAEFITWTNYYRVKQLKKSFLSLQFVNNQRTRFSFNEQETRINWNKFSSSRKKFIKKQLNEDWKSNKRSLFRNESMIRDKRRTQTSFNPLIRNPWARKNISGCHHFHVFVGKLLLSSRRKCNFVKQRAIRFLFCSFRSLFRCF